MFKPRFVSCISTYSNCILHAKFKTVGEKFLDCPQYIYISSRCFNLGYIIKNNNFPTIIQYPFHLFYHMWYIIQMMECCSAYNRSEEHTSELQSRGHLVCRLLLEKKKY